MMNIKHLFERAGFGYQSNVDRLSTRSALKRLFKATNNQLTTKVTLVDPSKQKLLTTDERKALKKQVKKEVRQVQLDWINLMITSENPLEEQMTLFLTNHFVVNHKRGDRAKSYNNLLRRNALGNFKTCAKEVFRHPAMISYLHLQQNKKQSPNEDFARELMELFTLGRDVIYTEADIKEVARAFTGWGMSKQEKFRVQAKLHDDGAKTIFGVTQNFTGDEVVDLIFAQKACAIHFSRKLCKHFLSETANNREGLESQMAEVLYKSNYDITPALEVLFTSDVFYKDVHQKIKSPAQFMAGLGKQMKMTYTTEKHVSRVMKALGMSLFMPPNVAGWPGGRDWIDSSRLVLRMNIGAAVVNGNDIEVENVDPLDTMPSQVSSKSFKRYKLETSTVQLPKPEDSSEWFNPIVEKKYDIPSDTVGFYIAQFSLPEYQLH